MTATVLDHDHYRAYLMEMDDHHCGELALSYEQWCAACRGKS
jgi:hypothetical protein